MGNAHLRCILALALTLGLVLAADLSSNTIAAPKTPKPTRPPKPTKAPKVPEVVVDPIMVQHNATIRFTGYKCDSLGSYTANWRLGGQIVMTVTKQTNGTVRAITSTYAARVGERIGNEGQCSLALSMRYNASAQYQKLRFKLVSTGTNATDVFWLDVRRYDTIVRNVTECSNVTLQMLARNDTRSVDYMTVYGNGKLLAHIDGQPPGTPYVNASTVPVKIEGYNVTIVSIGQSFNGKTVYSDVRFLNVTASNKDYSFDNDTNDWVNITASGISVIKRSVTINATRLVVTPIVGNFTRDTLTVSTDDWVELTMRDPPSCTTKVTWRRTGVAFANATKAFNLTIPAGESRPYMVRVTVVSSDGGKGRDITWGNTDVVTFTRQYTNSATPLRTIVNATVRMQLTKIPPHSNIISVYDSRLAETNRVNITWLYRRSGAAEPSLAQGNVTTNWTLLTEVTNIGAYYAVKREQNGENKTLDTFYVAIAELSPAEHIVYPGSRVVLPSLCRAEEDDSVVGNYGNYTCADEWRVNYTAIASGWNCTKYVVTDNATDSHMGVYGSVKNYTWGPYGCAGFKVVVAELPSPSIAATMNGAVCTVTCEVLGKSLESSANKTLSDDISTLVVAQIGDGWSCSHYNNFANRTVTVKCPVSAKQQLYAKNVVGIVLLGCAVAVLLILLFIYCNKNRIAKHVRNVEFIVVEQGTHQCNDDGLEDGGFDEDGNDLL